MERVSTDRGYVIVGSKKITVGEARNLLRKLRTRKGACHTKLQKTANRVKLLESFIDETRGTKITFADWMKSKGLDHQRFYRSMGYYTPLQLVVSDDVENQALIYHRDMKFNPDAGYYVPDRKIVPVNEHNIVTHSKLGMTYDPKLALYFPTTIYDTEVYSEAENSGDRAMDIMGGFTVEDLGRLTTYNYDSEELTETIKELFEEEFDNVAGEMLNIESAENEIYGNFSNADAKAGRNAICRAGCNFKRKSKRGECWSDCDKKFPPSEKQKERREELAERRGARKDKREGKKECKEQYKAGEITKAEYRDCKKRERKEKRAKIKESGGNFFARAWRGVAKVFPITASSRAGVLLIAKMNGFGFSTKIAPALVSGSEASKFKPSSIKKAKKAWSKLSDNWKNKLGGNPDKLKQAILEGYKKKPSKIEKQSSADGYNQYSFRYSEEEFSNFDPATWTLILSGVSTVLGFIVKMKKEGVDENPYNEGQTPPSYADALREGITTNLPEPDPNSPQLDPISGEWIDPSTGRPIDPLTGEFIDTILGMNKWLALGLGLAVVSAVIIIARRSK